MTGITAWIGTPEIPTGIQIGKILSKESENPVLLCIFLIDKGILSLIYLSSKFQELFLKFY